jgi:putative chitinase
MTAFDALPAALRAVAPALADADVTVWLAALLPDMRSSGLVTPRRIAAFLGQVAEESGGFTRLEEDLDYTALRLCQVWPSRFPNIDLARPFEHAPEALANHVYAGRLGNGDAASGDGWRFRGAGLIQLTGRTLYAQFAAAVGRAPEDAAAWLATAAGAAASACWYWTIRGHLNELADAWDIAGVTQRVNGGETNLATRIRLSNAALAALGGGMPPPAAGFADDPAAAAEDPADDLNAAELARIQQEPS